MRGGSQPHFMRCSDGHYYVVKFQGNPQGTRVLANELLGTRLAARLGLPTTEVAIIEVTEDLIQLTPHLHFEMPTAGHYRTRIPCRSGLQFGSRYPGDPHHLTLFDFLPDKQVSSMSNLRVFLGMLVFDLWTCNTDGRQVIFGRQEIGTPYQGWMIDQGFCFNGKEWNFPDKPRRNLHTRQVVYERVRGIQCFEFWLDRLESKIGPKLLLDIAKTIPPEWYEFDSESLHRLLEQLDSRRGGVRELLLLAYQTSPQLFPNWTAGGAENHDHTDQATSTIATKNLISCAHRKSRRTYDQD
jgi:hypothetical protein